MAYDPQVRDMRPKLTGQGTNGPLRLPYTTNARGHLWSAHVAPTPAVQNSVAVNKDGTVVEGECLTYEEMYGPQVHRVFVGGYDHRCDPVDDPLSWAALAEAGYSCAGPEFDIYVMPDRHTSEYPLVDSAAVHAAAQAILTQARLARIASLEAEAAVLRGLSP